MRSTSSAVPRGPALTLLALGALAALAAAAVLVAAGCGSSSTNLVGPTAQKCQISVTSFTGTFGASGGTGTAAISAARECSWSASSQASWISVAAGDGSGAGTVTFTVAANPAARARSGGLAVNGQQLTVSQAAAACTFSVAANPTQFGAAGGTGSVAVSTLDGCSWTASSGTSWLHLSGTGGSGSGSVAFSADPDAAADRTASLTVAGQTVSISQAGPAPVPAPGGPGPGPAPGCQFSVAPSALSFDASGGQATLRLTTVSGCAWQAIASDSWLTLSPSSGSKSDTITVTAAANPATSPRSASIAIGGQTVQVQQAAATGSTMVQLVGQVSKLKGGCPAVRFVVQGTDVVTNASTSYTTNGSCDSLRNGAQVIVNGVQQAGQPVLALVIAVTG